MLKKLLTILCVAATCASAAAAPVTYNFSYQGAVRDDWGAPSTVWDATYRVEGSFRGDDKDNNGVIDKSELEWMQVGFCWGNCNIDSFSYAPQGELEFSAIYVDHSTDPYYSVNQYSNLGSFEGVAMLSRTSYTYTADTQFTIAAVPEPSTYAMMGAGLLGLTVVRRRRKKAA